MPDYYANVNPATAFGTGLMQGYQFVEGIQNMRAQREADRQRLALAKAENARQEAAASRQQEGFDLGKEDRLTNIQRQNKLDAASAYAGLAIARGSPDNLTAADKVQLVSISRAADPTTQGKSDEEVYNAGLMNAYQHNDALVRDAQRLTLLGQNENMVSEILGGINARSSASGVIPAPGPKANAPTPAATAETAPGAPAVAPGAGPRGRTTAPGTLAASGYQPTVRPTPPPSATFDKVKFESTAKAYRDAQATGDPAIIARTQKAYYAAAGQGATDPVSQIHQAAAIYADPNASAVAKLGAATQATAAAHALALSTAKAAAPRGTVAVGERASTVLDAAVQAQQQAPGPTIDTMAGVTALGTSIDRLPASPKRVTPQQVATLSKAVAHGLLSMEAAQNYVKYGQLDKPEKPSLVPLGEGYVGMVTANGISLIALPGAGKGGKTAESDAQDRLTANDRMNQAFQSLKETYGKDNVQGKYNDFLEQIKRDAPNIQLHAGIPLVDPRTGALNFGRADPGEVSALVRWYQQTDQYNDTSVWRPWTWFRDKTTVSQQAAAEMPPPAAGEQGGWSIQPLQ